MDISLHITFSFNLSDIAQGPDNHFGDLLAHSDVVKPAQYIERRTVLPNPACITLKVRANFFTDSPQSIMSSRETVQAKFFKLRLPLTFGKRGNGSPYILWVSKLMDETVTVFPRSVRLDLIIEKTTKHELVCNSLWTSLPRVVGDFAPILGSLPMIAQELGNLEQLFIMTYR